MGEQAEISGKATPSEVRALIRQGKWRKPTAGLAAGYVQVNLVILPRELAYDFLLFAQRNPKPCPVIEVTDTGSPEPKLTAPGADLRTDVPKYRIYRDGKLEREVTDLLVSGRRTSSPSCWGAASPSRPGSSRPGSPSGTSRRERTFRCSSPRSRVRRPAPSAVPWW